MLESLEGRRGEIRVRPPLPAEKGLFGAPTIVNNVITLETVPTILANGAATYKDYGQARSRGTLPLQLAGNIRRGGLVERAFGLTVRELLEEYVTERSTVLKQIEASWARQSRRPSAEEIDSWINAGRE